MQQPIYSAGNKRGRVTESKIAQGEALQLVASYVNEIKRSGIDLCKVYLFGSYATNMQREWSDIDVALISDVFSGFGFNDLALLGNIPIKSEYISIHSKFYSTSYFNQGDPFIEEIIKTGIEIPLP